MESLNDILGNKIALSILRLLYALPDVISGREIASRIGYSPQATHNSLKKLETSHLITAKTVGRAKLYSISRKHWFLSDCLIPMWNKMDSWLELVGQFYIEKLPTPPLSVIVYGSFAKGEEHEESDLDLLFIYEDKQYDPSFLDDILNLNSSVFEIFGIHTSPKIISISDFKTAIKKSEGLMRNIFREGRTIAGRTLSEVIGYDIQKD
ncbi:MAG: nucleotidyltransferase domain-containing protein [Pseudomonadota bacterium]